MQYPSMDNEQYKEAKPLFLDRIKQPSFFVVDLNGNLVSPSVNAITEMNDLTNAIAFCDAYSKGTPEQFELISFYHKELGKQLELLKSELLAEFEVSTLNQLNPAIICKAIAKRPIFPGWIPPENIDGFLLVSKLDLPMNAKQLSSLFNTTESDIIISAMRLFLSQEKENILHVIDNLNDYGIHEDVHSKLALLKAHLSQVQ